MLFDISVIIPTYNRSKTIAYCLQSVLNQTLLPLEIIVVDDCSKDNTIQIIENINHPLIKLIKLEKNSGAQVARNRGIQEATGDWIAFQDSDDEWMPHKLEMQLVFVKQHNFSVVYTQGIILENGIQRSYNVQDYQNNTYKMLLENPGPMFQGLLVRKECFEKIGYLDIDVPSFQEWDTCIMLGKHFAFGFISEPLYLYHLHDGETISKDKLREALGVEYIVNKHKEDMVTHIGKIAYSKHLENIAQKFLLSGNYAKWKEYKIKQFEEQLPKVNHFGLKIFLISHFPRLYNTIRKRYVEFKEQQI